MPDHKPLSTDIVVAGLGGQGVLKASDILSDAAWLAGRDVKKSEIHGMAQRGGSVSSDVRYGDKVQSPMIPDGEAAFLMLLREDQLEPNRHRLAPDGVTLDPTQVPEGLLQNAKSLNVAMLALLSAQIDLPTQAWHDAIRRNLPEKLHADNLELFEKVRKAV